MTRSALARRIAAITLAATAVFGLAACTPSPAAPTPGSTVGADASGDDGQSVKDACALVQATIEDATAEFENAGTGDPAAVVEAVKVAAQKIADASSQITNDEVAAILPSLQDMFAKVGETMTALVQGDVTKIDDLSALGETFQTTTQKFQEICAP